MTFSGNKRKTTKVFASRVLCGSAGCKGSVTSVALPQILQLRHLYTVIVFKTCYQCNTVKYTLFAEIEFLGWSGI